ncbi:RelB/StbD replicon stabilization protein (antitoxin to RelE/StbE) [uncultured Candidatus Thioglobus sp.]|nr:RelB/StbD replicon stabilization protein (antitoxin to RelE/StbE) [uncultured Candidatus Thioglobus sp.]SMN01367.1 RelB/StbD replicon stabilization protein (antitoxin to RelE/StbE) [uncultured Candidatus Thioglobus sp.]
MSNLSTRSTVYFEQDIHQALKIKATLNRQSVSEMVNDAVRYALAEEQEDISAFNSRVNEPTVSYEALLNELKANGKI